VQKLTSGYGGSQQGSASSAALAPARSPLWLARTALAIAAVKLLLLVIDSSPRFFLWDSVTYLRGAVEGVLPRDRSFMYSLLIRAVAVPVHSLQALVVAQTLAGIGSALLVYVVLRRFLAVRYGFALIATLLVAIEPGQLFYEHMVMAEAFGSVIWLGFVALILAYVRDGRTFWLPAIALAGIAAIAFRLNGTATVLLIGPCLPLWRAWFLRKSAETGAAWPAYRRHIATQLVVAVTCTLIAHVGYRHIVGSIAHTEPGYIGTEGLFQLGYLAPVVTEKDFNGTGCDPDLLQHVELELSDPRNREGQLWRDGGLWSVMQRECPQPEAAADVVASRALIRIPASILPMALTTAAQYFDSAVAQWRMDSDLGRKGTLPVELIDLAKTQFSLDVHPIAFTDTLTSLWFAHSRWWFTACFFLCPVGALWLVLRRRRDASAACAKSVALIMLGLFFSQFLFSPIIAFRYLHPFPPLLILCAAAILERYAASAQAFGQEEKPS
jgi:hypothetical protein